MKKITLNSISKKFGTKTILEPLNLTLQAGTFTTLLGPSGCGKTTLLRMIAGLETPSTGEIKMDETVLFSKLENIPPEKRGFGMVFQSYAVWPHMNVEENVGYPLKFQKLSKEESKKRTQEALTLVHLEDYKDRYPSQLSGGQQQRVALARGLAMQPHLLLLDEPLSNLDTLLRTEMRKEIRDLQRKLGITILYVTHDQKEAFEMSHHIVVLNEGKIVQEGTPEAIRANPSPGFVQSFIQ